MISSGPSLSSLERLSAAGLRPTRQRRALAELVFGAGERHVSAEALHDEAVAAGVPVSLATVYNTLRRFTKCGLVREVPVAPGKVYFDTNVADHHHFFFEHSGELTDIPASDVELTKIPAAPAGATVARVDIIVRLTASKG